MEKGNAKEAIKLLEMTIRYQRAAKFYPQFVRGEAYLKLNKDEKAAAEFPTINDGAIISCSFGAKRT